jgi:hypothetical protein
MVFVSDPMGLLPKLVGLESTKIIKLTSRPPIQQHQAPLLPAKRKGAYRSHSRSPKSANHARQEEDLCKLSGLLRDEL